ncbi:MAG: ribonuclease E/G [Lachnospiraceae bacterium]
MKSKAVISRVDGSLVSAIFEDDSCVSISSPDPDSLTGDLFVGRVERVIPQLSCCFIEFQKGGRGYYPLKDNKYRIYTNDPDRKRPPKGGDTFVVQVRRPAVAPKEALLTSELTLNGYYLILVVGDPTVHFSKKLKASERDPELAENLKAIGKSDGTLPDFGFIVRTNAAGASAADILGEAKRLKARMTNILKSARTAPACSKIGEGPKEWESAIRELPAESDPEVITDIPEIFESLSSTFAGEPIRIRFYDDPYPLCNLYSLKTNRDRALTRVVHLKSGANLYIDKTEALTAIDVNAAASSSRGPGVPEKKKLCVNLEAADEVARQLRLRNISGMILVDFISMKAEEDKAALLTRLRQAVRKDTVPVQVLDMTRLGLVEITRKKEGRDVYEAFSEKPVL